MSAESPIDRPTLILDAADELFGKYGFSAVSMNDVAEQAGVNKALVFYHHGNKELLFEKVLSRYYAAHRAALMEAQVVEAPLGDRLHGLLDAYLDFVDSNHRYPRLVQSVVAGSSTHHTLIEENLKLLHGFVDDSLEGVAPPSGPRSAKHLFVTLSGAVINYFTYAPVLRTIWNEEPLSPEGVAERREHLHSLLDCLLANLDSEA